MPVKRIGQFCSHCGKRPIRPPTNWCVQCLATVRPLTERVVIMPPLRAADIHGFQTDEFHLQFSQFLKGL